MNVQLTASTQIKSVNAITDIENHSGKENRFKYEHENEKINKYMSHKNVEILVYDVRELLHNHYDEKIQKHNANNNSESRKWDLDIFLATFQDKEIMKGKKGKRVPSGNIRSATASQICYVGDDESLNGVFDKLSRAGASRDSIRKAYTTGVENYIPQYNETFPTLPIFNVNIHFDETTAHIHSGLAVLGHTKNGNPSDSINNALGEKYKPAETFKENKENMKKYREENDAILFECVTKELKELGKEHGLDIDFEMIRTGDKGFNNSKDYKKDKEFEKTRKELEDKHIEILEELSKLDKREEEISQANYKLTKKDLKLYSLGEDLKYKQEEQDNQFVLEFQRDEERRRKAEERELEIEEKNLELQKREKILLEDINKNKKYNKLTNAVVEEILKGDPKHQKSYNAVKENGIFAFPHDNVIKLLSNSISKMHTRKLPVEKVDTLEENMYQAIEDDGPDF